MTRRKQVLSAILIGIGGGALWLAQRVPGARAAPGPSPREWAQEDLRIPTDAAIVKAIVRQSMICNRPLDGTVVAGLLARAANSPKLNPAQATALACALGAPSAATCAQLGECTGVGGPVAEVATCDGSTLRVTTRADHEPMAIACSAFGEACYFNGSDAFCGDGLCDPFDTYACEGATLVQCLSGVRVRTPCGRGMTCGRASASKLVACVGAKSAVCAKSRCEAGVALTCVPDAFGGASERAVDCASMGLACMDTKSSDGAQLVACVPSSSPGPDGCAPEVAPTCKDGKVTVCGGAKRHIIACADLGLSGACAVTDATIACK